jgi:hypothetical protein
MCGAVDRTPGEIIEGTELSDNKITTLYLYFDPTLIRTTTEIHSSELNEQTKVGHNFAANIKHIRPS